MSCDQYQALLSETIEPDRHAGTSRLEALAPEERSALEHHLLECPTCRTVRADLERIARASVSLERHSPPDRVWARVAGALDLPARLEAGAPAASGSPAWRPWRWKPLAALAASALLVTGTLVGLRVGRSESTAPGADASVAEPPAAATAAATPESVERELRLAQEHYENAITGLESLASSAEDSLDPQVASTLRRNLAVIDSAIGESRAALDAQPASEPAQESLFAAFKSKIALLEDTIALVNEMRKGNQAEAARIVEGLK